MCLLSFVFYATILGTLTLPFPRDTFREIDLLVQYGWYKKCFTQSIKLASIVFFLFNFVLLL